MRLLAVIPLVSAIASFVLTLLALLAGKSPGFMEDYSIVMFNTSTLGHNLIPTPTTGSSGATTTTASSSGGGGIGGLFSSIVASATAAVGSAAGALESEAASIANKIGDDIADKLAEELGIHQFYSLHAMDTCEGFFSPNATAPSPGLNVTNCTTPMDFGYMNVSKLLDQELHLGPVLFSLEQLGIGQDLQDAINALPKLFEALAIMYILAVAFTGLAILGSLLALFLLPNGGRKWVLLNFIFTFFGMVFLLVGNLITTIGGGKAVFEVEDKGSKIGLAAVRGTKFLAITWAAFALITLGMFFWVFEFFAIRKANRGSPGKSRGNWAGDRMGRRRGQKAADGSYEMNGRSNGGRSWEDGPR